MIKRLNQADLLDKINVLLVSDHGMTQMKSTVVLSDLIDITWINKTKSVLGIVSSIWPRSDEFGQRVFDGLSKSPFLDVYYKKDMPERYHFKNNDRIGPIVVVAKEGYMLYEVTLVLRKGNHGFDNQLESMRAIFLAHGPDFKPNVKIRPVNSVDIYPLLCQLINVKCNPNNGTIKAFSQALVF